MFLFERVFGFSLYMFVLLFVCILLSKTTLSSKITLRFYIFCLCVMAFFYEPYITADLYRTFEMMSYFAEMDFRYFWANYAYGDSTAIAKLLYWCIGKTGINSLLPVFSAFACYSFIFYIILKTQKLFSVSKKNVAYVLFFVMTTSIYISVIGGIRMMLALSMIAFSYFRNTIEKKGNLFDVFLYVAAFFLHTMSLPVIGIGIVVAVLNSSSKFASKFVTFIAIAVLFCVLLNKYRYFIDDLYEKILYYIVQGNGYYDIWEYIMGCLILFVLLFLMYEFHRFQETAEYRILKPYNAVMLWSMVIAVCFCFEFSIFYRFGGQLAVIFSIPMMMVTLEKTSGKQSRVLKGTDFRSILMLLNLIIAFISCTRGSLSSLKFFVL